MNWTGPQLAKKGVQPQRAPGRCNNVENCNSARTLHTLCDCKQFKEMDQIVSTTRTYIDMLWLPRNWSDPASTRRTQVASGKQPCADKCVRSASVVGNLENALLD